MEIRIRCRDLNQLHQLLLRQLSSKWDFRPSLEQEVRHKLQLLQQLSASDTSVPHFLLSSSHILGKWSV